MANENNETRKRRFRDSYFKGVSRKLTLAAAGLALMTGMSGTSLAAAQNAQQDSAFSSTSSRAYSIPMTDPTGKHVPYHSPFDNKEHSSLETVRHAFTGYWNDTDQRLSNENKLDNWTTYDYRTPSGDPNPIYQNATQEQKRIADHNAVAPIGYYQVLKSGSNNGERIAMRESGPLMEYGGIRKIEELNSPNMFIEVNYAAGKDGSVDKSKVEARLSDAAKADPEATRNFATLARKMATMNNVSVVMPRDNIGNGIDMIKVTNSHGREIVLPVPSSDVEKILKDANNSNKIAMANVLKGEDLDRVVASPNLSNRNKDITEVISNKNGILTPDDMGGSITLTSAFDGATAILHGSHDGKNYELEWVKGDTNGYSYNEILHTAGVKAIADGVGLRAQSPESIGRVSPTFNLDISKTTGIEGQVVAMNNEDFNATQNDKNFEVYGNEYTVRTPAMVARDTYKQEVEAQALKDHPTQLQPVEPEKPVEFRPMSHVHLKNLTPDEFAKIDANEKENDRKFAEQKENDAKKYDAQKKEYDGEMKKFTQEQNLRDKEISDKMSAYDAEHGNVEAPKIKETITPAIHEHEVHAITLPKQEVHSVILPAENGAQEEFKVHEALQRTDFHGSNSQIDDAEFRTKAPSQPEFN